MPGCALKWLRSYKIASFFSNGQAVLLLSIPLTADTILPA